MEHVEQKIGPPRTWHHREEQDEDSGDHQGEFTINFVSSVHVSTSGRLSASRHVVISGWQVPLQAPFTCGTCNLVRTVSLSTSGLVQKAFIQNIGILLESKGMKSAVSWVSSRIHFIEQSSDRFNSRWNCQRKLCAHAMVVKEPKREIVPKKFFDFHTSKLETRSSYRPPSSL
jgi:hypothetical protein